MQCQIYFLTMSDEKKKSYKMKQSSANNPVITVYGISGLQTLLSHVDPHLIAARLNKKACIVGVDYIF